MVTHHVAVGIVGKKKTQVCEDLWRRCAEVEPRGSDPRVPSTTSPRKFGAAIAAPRPLGIQRDPVGPDGCIDRHLIRPIASRSRGVPARRSATCSRGESEPGVHPFVPTATSTADRPDSVNHQRGVADVGHWTWLSKKALRHRACRSRLARATKQRCRAVAPRAAHKRDTANHARRGGRLGRWLYIESGGPDIKRALDVRMREPIACPHS